MGPIARQRLGLAALATAAAATVFAAWHRVRANIRAHERAVHAALRDGDGSLARRLDLVRAQGRREDARRWPDDVLRRAVGRYVLELGHGSDDTELLRELEQQPARAAHHALRLLLDPSLAPVLGLPGPDRPMELRQTPVERACAILRSHPDPASLPALEPWLEATHDETRCRAACTIAAIGAPAVVPAVRRALRDREPGVRTWAVMGLDHAEGEGRLADATKLALFDDVLASIGDGWGERQVHALARWDPQRAAQVFRTQGLLEPGRFAFPAALLALLHHDQPLPREEVLALLRRLPASKALEHVRARGALLRVLARHREPADEPLIRSELAGGTGLARDAASALLSLHRLDDVDEIIAAKNKRWWPRLTSAQRRHQVMSSFVWLVADGGLSQFFGHSAANDWKHLLAAFDAHDPARAEIVREALRRFGEELATSQVRRTEQISVLYARHDDPFADLDRRCYALPTPIEVTLAQHALLHADELRAR